MSHRGEAFRRGRRRDGSYRGNVSRSSTAYERHETSSRGYSRRDDYSRDYEGRRDDSSRGYSQRHDDQPRGGYSRHYSERQDRPIERRPRDVSFEDDSRPGEAARDHRETVSNENLSREESESVVSVLIQIYPIVRPYTIRDSVYNPHNRQPPVNQGILLERCSRDIRSRMLHAAEAQEVPAALGAPSTSTSTVTGSSTGTRPTESSSAPRSVVGEDKTVKVSSAEEKRPIDSQDTKPTTGSSSKSENPKSDWTVVFCLFGVLRRFQHCTGHITTGSWKGRGNQYIEFARVVYCKLPTNGKQLPAFPLKAVTGIEPPTSEVIGLL